jgi:hypothetical protein
MYVTKKFSVRKYLSVLHALLPNIRKVIHREHVRKCEVKCTHTETVMYGWININENDLCTQIVISS